MDLKPKRILRRPRPPKNATVTTAKNFKIQEYNFAARNEYVLFNLTSQKSCTALSFKKNIFYTL